MKTLKDFEGAIDRLQKAAAALPGEPVNAAELYDRHEQVAIQILDSEFEDYPDGVLESLLTSYLDFGAQLLKVEFPEPRDQ